MKIDFLAENGSVIRSRTDALGEFGVMELRDGVPIGIVSMVVTNLGDRGAKITAHALVVDVVGGEGAFSPSRSPLKMEPATPS